MIYVACFVTSVLFAYWASKVKNRIIAYVCGIMCVLLPAILAGCRDITIGTDTRNYINNFYYDVAYAENIVEYVFIRHKGVEPLFSVLFYCVIKLTNNINLLLFIEELLIMSCVYIGALKHKDKVSVSLSMLIFFCLHYNATYNVTRQYIAIAILFLGLDKLEKKEYLKYCIYIIVASLFHNSAIIIFILIFIHYFFEKKKNWFYEVVFIICCFVALFAFVPILEMLINMGIVDSRYVGYLGNTNPVTANFLSLILLVLIIIVLIFQKRLEKIEKNVFLYNKSMVIQFVLLWGTRKIYFGHRLANYFAITDLLLIPLVIHACHSKKHQIMVKICIVMVFLFYWYYVSIRGNSGETFPYRSDILGI